MTIVIVRMTQEAGHGVVGADARGVVEAMDAKIDGFDHCKVAPREFRQVATHSLFDERLQGREGIAAGNGIRGVHFDEELRRIRARKLALELAGHVDHELHVAALEECMRLIRRMDLGDDAEVLADLQGAHERAHEGTAVLTQHRRRQVLGVGVDREAEEQELHDRQHHDHAESHAVAAQLDEFLAEDAAQSHPGQALPAHGLPSVLSGIRWMNTSSSVGCARDQWYLVSARKGPSADSSSASARPTTCRELPKGVTEATPGRFSSSASSVTRSGPLTVQVTSDC